MLRTGRGGVARSDAQAGFAPQTERLAGNNTPGWTGPRPGRFGQGPHPPGQVQGGQLGSYDGYSGADPTRAPIQPHPHRTALSPMQETDKRWGIQGFNDQKTRRDRHVYWGRGTMRTGISPSVPGNPPNPMSDGPARASLKSVNISLSHQIGSDATSNADDFSRPYTWLGQNDGSTQPVYGGVPGLWVSYGNRGFTQGIHDPTNGDGGPVKVYSGPPHGYHSDTLPSGKQAADRYKVNPQMQAVRVDRPANSRIAGQSYSQTVVAQGESRPGRSTRKATPGVSFGFSGRGWSGGRR
jgi:hypothetical protein